MSVGLEAEHEIVALIGDYAATAILLNVADQHVRPQQKSLLPIP
jgi:hypothetical protein